VEALISLEVWIKSAKYVFCLSIKIEGSKKNWLSVENQYVLKKLTLSVKFF